VNAFLGDFEVFLSNIIRPGIYNSLSQTFLKIASPGVPDIYQVCDTLNFGLVDPDNRRAVDYVRLKCLLASLPAKGNKAPDSEQLLKTPEDRRAKLFVTLRAPSCRRAQRESFAEGKYVSLKARGEKKEHILAFVRGSRRKTTIAMTGIFFFKLGAEKRLPLGGAVWGDSVFSLKKRIPRGTYRKIFSGQKWEIGGRESRNALPVSEVFSRLPVAFLVHVP
jgi:(1->4)-alpha-D-glucan 1-alpha-D-glucosylmutase